MPAPADHIDRVHATIEALMPPLADGVVSSSWERSANTYGVDPASNEPPRILTQHELKDFRSPLAKLIVDAQDEFDRLYQIVGRARYAILFCDHKGVVVDHRGQEAEAENFIYWGTWLGGVWSEDIEGTNGIGTCITEVRPVTVHQSQHFRARHTSLSCSGAPIFGADGELAAVLDVSSIDPRLSEQSHALTGALTEAAARAIEERHFREHFRREWIVAIAPPLRSSMLFSVDGDHRIIGADRTARNVLSRHNHDLQRGVSLWSLFERDDAVFRRGDGGDLPTHLAPIGIADRWPSLITPPEGVWRNVVSSRMHTQPRLFNARSHPPMMPRQKTRALLPARTLRRVFDYVDAHLNENIELENLANAAGLSVFHFARTFKQTQGVTPHSYLMQRRVERAQELLVATDLSLSQIAAATGFSDQSHLARRFHALFGVAPGAFRRSNR